MKSGCGGRWGVVFGLTFVLAGGAALANDGGLAFGGSPGLLQGHPTVAMQSEIINVTVADDSVSVDCQFVFRNDGVACTVRMGFPDVGEGAEDPDEEADPKTVLKTPAKTTFQSFVSYVNGKKVATQLIRANEAGHFWHSKTVKFPAHSVVKVRDVYTQRVSGGIAIKGSYASAGYVLHTGSSWHGSIGRSEINVLFKRKSVTGPLEPLVLTGFAGDRDWSQVKGNQVYYVGPAKPSVKGKNLQFVRTKWKPKNGDDIFLYFKQ